MHLSRNLRFNRRVWIWTTIVLFILLGFIDPDGRGTGKMDLPTFFGAVAEMAKPFHWLGDSRTTDPLWLLTALSGLIFMIFIAIYFVVIGFVSAFVGFLLQFAITPLLPLHAPSVAEVTATVSEPEDSSIVPQNGTIQLLLAAYGGGAAIFGAVVTGLNGIQFWCIWFIYDQIHRMLTGYHTWSSFHSLVLLLLVALLNPVTSALLARKISSSSLNVRLRALAILGVQLATLVLSASAFGLPAL